MVELVTNVDVLIVGAGFAGLIAANRIQQRGQRVAVLDKGRSVGGRMASRRLGSGVADHGAQFFTVREQAFQEWVDRWIEEKLVYRWSMGWSDGSLAPLKEDGHPRYAVRGGMNALAKRIARDIDEVRVNIRIKSVKMEGEHWVLEDDLGRFFGGRSVLLTPPVPQSLELLNAGNVQLDEDEREALEAVEYMPCLTGMFRIKDHVTLPAPGAIQRRNSPISWIANNRQKGISDETIITVQADGVYSAQLWDSDDERVLKALRTDMRVYLPKEAEIVEEQLKRWKYSWPTNLYPDRCMLPTDLPGLVLAGDSFGGARMEGAFLSGLAAASAIS